MKPTRRIMNPPPSPPGKGVARDMETFGQLPAKTQELELLRDASEKAIGPEGLVLDRKIQAKAKSATPRPPEPAA